MELTIAAVLGVVQGLTEFLPISSSAHLILVPWLFGWKLEGIVFDVSLHFGTALATLTYFWRDWVEIATETLRGIAAGKPLGNPKRRLAWFLLLGTIPAASCGFLFEDHIEKTLRSPLIAVTTLAVLGLVLYIGEVKGRRQRSLEHFTWTDAVWIGSSQALALIPGVSRSGITMSVALLRDADRTSAARFSFLLATPVIVGAALLEGARLLKSVGATAGLAGGNIQPAAIHWEVLAVGTFCAALTGFLCIRYFLRYLQVRTFVPFVIYRFILAAIVLLCYLQTGFQG